MPPHCVSFCVTGLEGRESAGLVHCSIPRFSTGSAPGGSNLKGREEWLIPPPRNRRFLSLSLMSVGLVVDQVFHVRLSQVSRQAKYFSRQGERTCWQIGYVTFLLKNFKHTFVFSFQITKGIQNHVLDTLCPALCQVLCKYYLIQFSQTPSQVTPSSSRDGGTEAEGSEVTQVCVELQRNPGLSDPEPLTIGLAQGRS